jgi:arylsulfatase A-like enzyme
MDVVWLILDSVSATATPFCDDGVDTMPRLSSLAADHGTVFTNAYAPGPASPSSHASMFTNRLPSRTGMHEAFPYYDGEHPLLAEVLDDKQSFLVSANPFVFNGLDAGFDETDDLLSSQYMVFESGADPHTYTQRHNERIAGREWLRFAARSDATLRSLVNGFSYRLVKRRRGSVNPEVGANDEERHQYATTMNDRIRAFRDGSSEGRFVVANYMDAHPPFDASDAALAEYAPDTPREDLPTGVSGHHILRAGAESEAQAADLTRRLYHAVLWDLDRKIAPLIEELIQGRNIVVLTADHGNWIGQPLSLAPKLLHVPLIVFDRDRSGRTVSHTVNTRHLPTTTMDVFDEPDPFDGESLLGVQDDRLSISESIHPAGSRIPVAVHGDSDLELQRDIAAIRGDARVDHVDGSITRRRGSDDAQAELAEELTHLKNQAVKSGSEHLTYDDAVDQRLSHLGYK